MGNVGTRFRGAAQPARYLGSDQSQFAANLRACAAPAVVSRSAGKLCGKRREPGTLLSHKYDLPRSFGCRHERSRTVLCTPEAATRGCEGTVVADAHLARPWHPLRPRG